MTEPIIFLVAAGLIGLLILGFVVVLSRRNHKTLDVGYYRNRWQTVEDSIDKTNSPSFALAVLNADKLVDQAMQQKNYKGTTMGERLKSSKGQWTNENALWTAHKIRNKIAHEPDANLTYDLTKQALAAFRQALKDLGAL